MAGSTGGEPAVMGGSAGAMAGSNGGEPAETGVSAGMVANGLSGPPPGTRSSGIGVETPGRLSTTPGPTLGGITHSLFVGVRIVADRLLREDRDLHAGGTRIGWMLESGGAAVGHRDPDLREHFCGHALDAVGEAAGCRRDTRGGDGTEGGDSDEHVHGATAAACRARPSRRATSCKLRPEEGDRIEFADEFGLGGRSSGGGQDMYEWLVGGWKRAIVGGTQQLIDEHVIEGEGIVVEACAVTDGRHRAFISDSTVHIVTPRAS